MASLHWLRAGYSHFSSFFSSHYVIYGVVETEEAELAYYV